MMKQTIKESIEEILENYKKKTTQEFVETIGKVYDSYNLEQIDALNQLSVALAQSIDEESLEKRVLAFTGLSENNLQRESEEESLESSKNDQEDLSYNQYISLRGSGMTHKEIKQAYPNIDSNLLRSRAATYTRYQKNKEKSSLVGKSEEPKDINYTKYRELRDKGKTNEEIIRMFPESNLHKLVGFEGNYQRYVVNKPEEKEETKRVKTSNEGHKPMLTKQIYFEARDSYADEPIEDIHELIKDLYSRTDKVQIARLARTYDKEQSKKPSNRISQSNGLKVTVDKEGWVIGTKKEY